MLADLLTILPKSFIGRDLGLKHGHITSLLNHPEAWPLENLFHLARLLDVLESILLQLAFAQYRQQLEERIKMKADIRENFKYNRIYPTTKKL
jgi:hypothetical protein